MKAGIGIIPTLVLACVMGVVLPYPEHSEAAEQMIVTARRLAQRPSGPNDPVWNGVPPAWLHVKGRDSFSNEDVKVSMKAAYTPGRHLFSFQMAGSYQKYYKKGLAF